MKNYKFIINGRVQGVFYRKSTYEKSIKENFSGYVKNLPNGSVEACVTCNENDINRFIEILKKGSTKSIVKNIERHPCDETFSGDFEIRY
ncbi:acylphosphatase [Candidatus Sulfurimonas marisnigri]|uniref:acylphosphatase n=1 Tax=Candidatus Sulfurimonas marisnigri TaxID=2740405 RepID=A0A7S7M279_9BACT|nr:acylphosphatase [Candidatus Sulfurimonas marisnigri]QOY55761.1 acylphosphatase [Candidatus Sulfurimonas marisnigri]